ncbi:MAG: hypothetical protein A2W91_13725 [Bacteroidetes bacterium GWF2_38_335]|nr:MAG: hypothetical protein A2W91_13725 [Bacteroidetes bacterium GWF2_38_335]OFY77776.1 MAG: hypothetical protein A2281_15415 [Bacteroidetes bacterium RIFOXYA12_FULL_38_20]HBS87420.1 hypothetical protein [Bacteroidales bacterium]
MVFSGILMLEAMIFIVLMIQLSDSQLLRVTIGFIGIAMAVSSIVVGGFVESKYEKISLPLAAFHLAALIFTAVTLGLDFFNNFAVSESGYSSSISPGVMFLAASLIGGTIVGLKVLIINPKHDKMGFHVARTVLILLFLWILYEIYAVVFLALLATILKDPGIMTSITLNNFRYNLLLNLGNNYQWHFSFIFAIIVQYRFFNNWWWKAALKK